MAYPIEWKGWSRYSNTGTRFRQWEFTETVPELKANKGDKLHDQGPKEKGERFAVDSRAAGGKWTWYKAETIAKVIFDGTLPEWDPPVESQGSALSYDAETAIIAAGAALTRLASAYTKDAKPEEKNESEKPHPRGVYVFPGEGHWGRDVIAAYDSRHERIERREIREEDSPEEVACYASNLQRLLDKRDPILPPPPSGDSAAVEALIAGGGETIVEPWGRALLRKADDVDWRAFHLYDRWRETKPRECSECGERYQPTRSGKSKTMNTRRCRACPSAPPPRRRTPPPEGEDAAEPAGVVHISSSQTSTRRLRQGPTPTPSAAFSTTLRTERASEAGRLRLEVQRACAVG